MIRLPRDVRLIPLVLMATAALLGLKTLGLVLDGGYILDVSGSGETMQRVAAVEPTDSGDIVGSVDSTAKEKTPDTTAPAATAPVVVADHAATPSKPSWAHEMFNFPDVTGSVSAKKESGPAKSELAKGEKPVDPKVHTAARSIPEARSAALEPRPISQSERAILERLQDRRQQLETRARELDMREALIKAAEKRLESRVAELKQLEGSLKTAEMKKDESEASRFKGLVAMYENMKAKDAARIFDRLDMKILVDVASHINPRRMADILANMSSETAERLTVEFASRGGAKAPAPADLPKIEGRPSPGRW